MARVTRHALRGRGRGLPVLPGQQVGEPTEGVPPVFVNTPPRDSSPPSIFSEKDQKDRGDQSPNDGAWNAEPRRTTVFPVLLTLPSETASELGGITLKRENQSSTF